MIYSIAKLSYIFFALLNSKEEEKSMNKSLKSAALFLSLALALVACGNSKTAQSSTAPAESSAKSSKAEEPKKEESKKEESSVAVVLTEKETQVAEQIKEFKASAEKKDSGVYVGKDAKDADATVYYAESEPSHGWTAFESITVKDGKVIDSQFDYNNEAGQLKSLNKEYIEAMKSKSKTQTDISVVIAYLNSYLTKDTDLTKLDADAVTGATNAADEFKTLSTKLLTEAGLAK